MEVIIAGRSWGPPRECSWLFLESRAGDAGTPPRAAGGGSPPPDRQRGRRFVLAAARRSAHPALYRGQDHARCARRSRTSPVQRPPACGASAAQEKIDGTLAKSGVIGRMRLGHTGGSFCKPCTLPVHRTGGISPGGWTVQGACARRPVAIRRDPPRTRPGRLARSVEVLGKMRGVLLQTSQRARIQFGSEGSMHGCRHESPPSVLVKS